MGETHGSDLIMHMTVCQCSSTVARSTSLMVCHVSYQYTFYTCRMDCSWGCEEACDSYRAKQKSDHYHMHACEN